jgi:hypothetical protein
MQLANARREVDQLEPGKIAAELVGDPPRQPARDAHALRGRALAQDGGERGGIARAAPAHAGSDRHALRVGHVVVELHQDDGLAARRPHQERLARPWPVAEPVGLGVATGPVRDQAFHTGVGDELRDETAPALEFSVAECWIRRVGHSA